jgi:hypothetical protein
MVFLGFYNSGAGCLGWDAAEKGNFKACQIARALNVFNP